NMRLMTAPSEESHPAPSMDISSIGEKTNSHLDGAHGSLRLALAQTQRFNRQRGASQKSPHRGLHSCADLARPNLSDGQFQFDLAQAGIHPWPERPYPRVAFEPQPQATQFLFPNFDPVPRP